MVFEQMQDETSMGRGVHDHFLFLPWMVSQICVETAVKRQSEVYVWVTQVRFTQVVSLVHQTFIQ